MFNLIRKLVLPTAFLDDLLLQLDFSVELCNEVVDLNAFVGGVIAGYQVEVVQYEDIYRLCYIRGPEGILIGLAQELGQQTS